MLTFESLATNSVIFKVKISCIHIFHLDMYIATVICFMFIQKNLHKIFLRFAKMIALLEYLNLEQFSCKKSCIRNLFLKQATVYGFGYMHMHHRSMCQNIAISV